MNLGSINCYISSALATVDDCTRKQRGTCRGTAIELYHGAGGFWMPQYRPSVVYVIYPLLKLLYNSLE